MPSKLPALKKTTEDWLPTYELLVKSDEWLMQKLNRQRRLKEIDQYIDKWCPEVKTGKPGLVVDVGCGPGEFLEIARMYGNTILGVDASSGLGGMGDQYLAASKMLLERQKVPAIFEGLDGFLFRLNHHALVGVKLINFRGSIEQCFADFMEGEPHHIHHNCKRLRWRIDERLESATRFMLTSFKCCLNHKGSLLIHANGAANTDDWYSMISEVSREIDFPLEFRIERVLKWTV